MNTTHEENCARWSSRDRLRKVKTYRSQRADGRVVQVTIPGDEE
jgi:hypothetical protein